jgi:hypothetical protein
MKRIVGLGALLFILVGIGLAQQITVTQPAAGVTWNTGGTYVIQWTSTGTTKPAVKIMLWKSATFVMDIVESTPNSGSFSWTIPTTLAADTYKIRVRTIGDNIVGIGGAFSIAAVSANAPVKVARPLADAQAAAAARLKFPALSISDVKLVPYEDGLVITFAYKNSGTGPLPKASDMPVKPNYRVLIDNKEVAQGSLIFPAFEAQPGWEVPSFYGYEIKYQTSVWDDRWTIGNLVTIKINENKVNGMAGDSQSYNLKPMALNFSYDAMITDVTYDWAEAILKMTIRIDGNIGSLNKFRYAGTCFGVILYKTIDMIPGQRLYTIARKLEAAGTLGNEGSVALEVFLAKSSDGPNDFRDIDHRNNRYNHTFRR